MSGTLAGKTALITGGSKGIGAATSLLLAKAGANVAINYSSDASAAEDIAKQIGHEHSLLIQGDAGSIQDIERMVSDTVEKFGKIDIVIPCAGILLMKNLEATTEADFDKSHNLNVKGPYFLCQKAAPHMPEGSHIVFISTTQCAASSVAAPYLLYNSTKGAIEQMTRVMCKDLAPKGISVNAVAPGPTGTELFYRGKTEQMLKMVAGFSPMGRIGRPEEIAEAIVWLSSGSSSWISGQILRANGGMA
ncbi:MAG: hypothetical protein ASARMPREDX12_002242 [Alectoria sarmentosa]|nr:MAG: hypothetical protein ASARMPREDX12_002242 [Alectoria sarmentosa]CAD6580917.1 MAG: hypothetical protein ASARMPRED_000365 [Alectoria sarmentosa]